MPLLRMHLLQQKRQISVLYADGDMFESFYDILYNLYDLLVPGGWFICDDCGIILEAGEAVQQFRVDHNLTEPTYRYAEFGDYGLKQNDFGAEDSAEGLE